MRFFLLLDIAALALLVYCLIDCIQTDSALVRNLPKPFWLVLIVLLPLLGGIAWLLAGRPERTATAAPGRGPWAPPRERGASGYPPPRPIGPDDDEEFLRQMRAIDAEHQRTLDQWERDLRERERKLRDGEPPADDTPPADGPKPSGGPR